MKKVEKSKYVPVLTKHLIKLVKGKESQGEGSFCDRIKIAD